MLLLRVIYFFLNMNFIQEVCQNGLYMLSASGLTKLALLNQAPINQPINLTQEDQQKYYTAFELLLNSGVCPNSPIFQASSVAHAARNNYLAKKVVFFIQPLYVKDVEMLVKFNPTIEHLAIYTTDHFALTKNSKYTSFFHTESCDALVYLSQMIQAGNLPALQKIDLDFNFGYCAPSNLSNNINILKYVGPRLHQLKLTAPCNISIQTITANSPNLKALDLNFFSIPILPSLPDLPILFNHPLKTLEKLTKLEKLVIKQHVTNISYLSGLNQLKYLSIIASKEGLFDQLPNLPRLTQLRIIALNDSLTPDGLIAFAAKMPQLEYLDLTNWANNSEKISKLSQKDAIIKLLRQSPHIKHISGLGLFNNILNNHSVLMGLKYSLTGAPIPEQIDRQLRLYDETVLF
jgi:hypothetical protein